MPEITVHSTAQLHIPVRDGVWIDEEIVDYGSGKVLMFLVRAKASTEEEANDNLRHAIERLAAGAQAALEQFPEAVDASA